MRVVLTVGGHVSVFDVWQCNGENNRGGSVAMLRKRYFHYIREGKAYVIMNSVINGSDSAVHELMHYKVEGIDISQGTGTRTVQRFEDFWRYIVKAKVDIVQLVFDDALAFNFQVNGDLGGHEPYAGYERRLDIELFSRANSRMVDNLVKRLWEEEYAGLWCDNRDEFKLLVLMLYCMFELGDCQAMLRKYVVGFDKSGIFPLWLGQIHFMLSCEILKFRKSQSSLT